MPLFKGLSNKYDKLWQAIIRPKRDEYKLQDLGPNFFTIQGRKFTRTDVSLKNKRGLYLECSHFEPQNRPCKKLPCVIYLHGNSSSRLEAICTLEHLLTLNMTVFCFDFTGCGRSEGEYISLGWYERDDVQVVMEHLRELNSVTSIGLWGRSMGAVTALLHADRDYTIGGLVLDSPFSSLKLLCEELIKKHSKLPNVVVNTARKMVKKTIKEKAKFDMGDIEPIKHVSNSYVPAFFIAASGDTFIDPRHTEDLHKKYAGDKEIRIIEGNHNSSRPKSILSRISLFFSRVLQADQLKFDKSYVENEKKKYQQMNVGYQKMDVLPSTLNIGNENDIVDLLGQAEEDELQKAIEESMKNGFDDVFPSYKPKPQEEQESDNKEEKKGCEKPKTSQKVSNVEGDQGVNDVYFTDEEQNLDSDGNETKSGDKIQLAMANSDCEDEENEGKHMGAKQKDKEEGDEDQIVNLENVINGERE